MEGGTFSAALNGEEIIHWHMPTQTKLFQSHIVCITELIGATGRHTNVIFLQLALRAIKLFPSLKGIPGR